MPVIIKDGRIILPQKNHGKILASEIARRRQQTFAVIPRDPQRFYEDFGGLPHPSLRDKKGKPIISMKLAPYQYAAWNYKGNLLVVKSNKIGLTTSFSLEDFQTRLLPEEAGFDVLLVAQNAKIANEHIRDLKRMIRNSIKYRKYLIERPTDDLMLEERSKASVAYIANPYQPSRPSRIIGLGSSEANAYSWKNVNRIHMSDVSLLDIGDQKEFFAALYSRLANTNGTIKIESVPNGQQGEVWNIYNKFLLEMQTAEEIGYKDLLEYKEENKLQFKVILVPAQEAVLAGLITQEFLDGEKLKSGDLVYEQMYECKFVAPGNQFYQREWLTTGDHIL